jgi:hypothetical protein
LLERSFCLVRTRYLLYVDSRRNALEMQIQKVEPILNEIGMGIDAKWAMQAGDF